MGQSVSNFDFLDRLDGELANLGRLAESYFQDDPSTSLIKLRQFAERLSRRHAALVGVDLQPDDTQSDILRRLKYERAVPDRVLDVLHHIRKLGNTAVHESGGDHREALACLKMSVQLGVWHIRTSTADRDFSVGSFIPPRSPANPTQELQDELSRLRSERDAALTVAQKAEEARQQAMRDAESAKERHQREVEERQIWEALAQDADRQLQEFITEAKKQVPATMALFVQAANDAAGAIDLDEQATRALIDQQLRDRGWETDSVDLRYGKGTRPVKGRNIAIAEWPTASGPADYALFAGETCLGIVEAKRYRKNVSAAVDQAERYSKGFVWAANADKWDDGFVVPFVFATNGRPYLKQVETESGIWFRDVRLASNLRRALMGWFRPEELLSMLEVEKEKAQASLAARSFDFGFQLRPYQKAAIEAVEKTLSTEKREMLVAMATGTGKTKLAIAMLYRLLATKRFRRICFVVDRSALGTQTTDEFMSTAIEGPKTFGQLFGIKGLEDIKPDPETRVHICTIQGLVKRVLYNNDPADVPPIGQYDLMVIDECHRGYLLDREMSDAELGFRGQDDYISKYRRVLEYFDAVKIGLTATPALHTAQIFGDPIYTYTYREAVVDGWLIDHEPPIRFQTALAKAGITFDVGDAVEVLDSHTGEVQNTVAPDELNFKVEDFNRKVITQPFNQVVAEELAKHIDPSLEGKTLVFAATENQACAALLENAANAESMNFIWKYLKSQTESLKAAGRGGAQPNISQAVLKAFPIPLPPLPEQRRIVHKLDTLSARTTTARTHLTAIEKLVPRYKLAVLRSAYRGNLTADFRRNNALEPVSALLERTPPPQQGRGGRQATTEVKAGQGGISVNIPDVNLPEKWEWVSLLRIARQETGHTPSRSRDDWWGGDVCWMSIPDANLHHGRVIFDTIQKTNEQGLANSSARLLPAGTVVLSRTASVGYICIMGREMATSQDFATWTCTDALLPEYLMYALLSEGEDIKKFGEGSTHTTIYFPEIRAFHIKLAPLDEQREIVRRIETAFAKIDRLAAEAAKALKLLGCLDQRILAKAFAGELVPQDPTDEPAEALLARIREARAAASKPKHGRKASA